MSLSKLIDHPTLTTQAQRVAAAMPQAAAYRTSIQPGAARGDITINRPDAADLIDVSSLLVAMTPDTNGHKDAEEQGAKVQFLSDDERLLLPLYMSSTANTNARYDSIYHAYLVVDLLNVASRADLDAAFGTANNIAGAAPYPAWVTVPLQAAFVGGRITDVSLFTNTAGVSRPRDGAGARADEVEVRSEVIELVINGRNPDGTNGGFTFVRQTPVDTLATMFGIATRIGADPRDFRALAGPDMSMADNYFQDEKHFELNRMQSKLHAHTISVIAAMNYDRVGSVSSLAWTRAYMVSAGVLRDGGSRLQSEVAFTQAIPSRATLALLSQHHESDPDRVLKVAYSIAAMFGLQHLARDHTFKTGDTIMERVNASYAKTLSTVTTTTDMNDLLQKKHELHRLTCHPIGLAQCYYVAMWGARHKRIAEALQIRVDTYPPPLNRASLVVGVLAQIMALPVGSLIKKIYGESYNAISAFLSNLGRSRPHYSNLARLYGYPSVHIVPANIVAACNTVLPLAAGYAEAFHSADPAAGRQHATGAALAQSIANVKRDNAALVTLFRGLFTQYIEASKEKGLEKFLEDQYAAITQAAQGGGGNASGVAP